MNVPSGNGACSLKMVKLTFTMKRKVNFVFARQCPNSHGKPHSRTP